MRFHQTRTLHFENLSAGNKFSVLSSYATARLALLKQKEISTHSTGSGQRSERSPGFIGAKLKSAAYARPAALLRPAQYRQLRVDNAHPPFNMLEGSG